MAEPLDTDGPAGGTVRKGELSELLASVRGCTVCARTLPLGPRPIVQAGATARVVIIGQAPGRRVHDSGIPWDDPSGRTLRDWLGVTAEEFYDPARIALVPMGFCYPGAGPSGDRPPRPECAPLWHERILAELPEDRLDVIVGSYAAEALRARGTGIRDRDRCHVGRLPTQQDRPASSIAEEPRLVDQQLLVRDRDPAGGAKSSAGSTGRRRIVSCTGRPRRPLTAEPPASVPPWFSLRSRGWSVPPIQIRGARRYPALLSTNQGVDPLVEGLLVG